MLQEMLQEMLKAMLKAIVLALLVVVLVIHGSATKLQTSRKIKLQGAINGNADFDGSKDIVINTEQKNISILTGNITLAQGNLDSSETTEIKLEFPEGFNKDNCFVIAQGIKVKANTTNGFSYGSTSETDVFTWADGLLPYRIILGDSNGKILIKIDNYTDKREISYKIVLMKI